ncbi:hypothetical protein V9W64_10555 [Neisseria leonii]|uniref:Uncharacterized protein n=1 Tax=Neisseria leonii TaxID=2995413 RepID=A0A9X4E262_9NEIS|nr:hypothetical protein [Neisseria sp. 51.81]MDD9328236.1 hypothetical protein [Neisseria sp. 51.81]
MTQPKLYRWLQMLEQGRYQQAADEIHEILHNQGFHTPPVTCPQGQEVQVSVGGRTVFHMTGKEAGN